MSFQNCVLFLCFSLIFISGCQYDYIIEEKEYKVFGDDAIRVRTFANNKTRLPINKYNHPNYIVASRIQTIIGNIGCDTIGTRMTIIAKGHFREYIRVAKFYKKGGREKFFAVSDVKIISLKLATLFGEMNSSQRIFFKYAGYNVYMYVLNGTFKIIFDPVLGEEKKNSYTLNKVLEYQVGVPKKTKRINK